LSKYYSFYDNITYQYIVQYVDGPQNFKRVNFEYMYVILKTGLI